MKGVIIFLVFFLEGTAFLSAQNTFYELPFYFGQFYKDPLIDNGQFENKQKGTIAAGHRRNHNNFGGVNTSYADLKLKLSPNENQAFSTIGLQFINDNEGFLIRRNRFYLNFERHIKINETYFMAGGVSLGGYNFIAQPDDGFEGISSLTYDGNVTLKFYGKKSVLKFAFNQIFNSRIKPINQEIVLLRNLNLFLGRNFNVSKNITSRNRGVIRWSKERDLPSSGFNFAFNTQLLVKKLVFFGMTIDPAIGLYYNLGVERIPVFSDQLGFELSYLVPKESSIITNLNQFEFTVSYKIFKEEGK